MSAELAVAGGSIFLGVSTIMWWGLSQLRRIAAPLAGNLKRETELAAVELTALQTQRSPLARRLMQAGLRSLAIYRFLIAIRIIGFVVAGALIAWSAVQGLPSVPIRWLTIGIIAGSWLLPNQWVKSRIQKRSKQINKYLADALDLFVICLEAGLGFNSALVRVAKEISWSSPVLSDELQYTNREILMGRPRAEALRNLGDRCGSTDFKSLLAVVIQAEKFGMSMAKTFRVQVDSIRTKRRQKIQEIIHKMPIKMVFPLVCCIFPELMVVLLGPAAINIWRYFVQGDFGGK